MEVLGGVASGISIVAFTGKILESAIKLKGFIDDVKDAPEDCKYMLEQIQIAASFLQHFEDDFHSEMQDSAIAIHRQNCKKACGKALEELQAILRISQTQIERKTSFARTKMVLNKPHIEKIKERLREAQRYLSLTQLAYMEAFRQMQDHQRHIAYLAELQDIKNLIMAHGNIVKRKNESAEEPGQICVRDREVVRNDSAKYSYSLQLPSWWPFSWLMVDLSIWTSSYRTGWQLNDRPYRRILWDDPVVTACERGDINTLRRLLDSRNATVDDVIMDCQNSIGQGRTLLQVAMDHQQYQLCRLLLERGAATTNYKLLIRDISFSRYHTDIVCKDRTMWESSIATLRDILTSQELHSAADLAGLWGRSEIISPSLFYDWMIYCRMSWAVLDDTLRWDAFRSCKPRNCVDGLRLSPSTISFEQVTAFLRCTKTSRKVLLLSGMISRFALRYDDIGLEDLLFLKKVFAETFASNWLFPELIRREDSLMLAFLGDCHWQEVDSRPSWEAHFAGHLSRWLTMLYDAGIDLIKYGRIEDHILRARCSGWQFELDYRWVECSHTNGMKKYRIATTKLHIAGVEYGATPADWKLKLYPIMSNHFRSFWSMVEDPVQHIPGAFFTDEDEYSARIDESDSDISSWYAEDEDESSR